MTGSRATDSGVVSLFALAGLVALVVAVETGTAGPADIGAGAAPGATATSLQAASAESPPLSFEDDSIAVTRDELGSPAGVRVAVRNETTMPLPVRGTVALPRLKAAATPERLRAEAVTRVQPPRDPIQPGASGELVLRSRPALERVEEGTFSGSLAAYSGGTARVVRVPLSLTTAPKALPAPEPAVPKHTVQAVRGAWRPGRVTFDGNEIPLDDEVPPAAKASDIDLKPTNKLLGVLTTDTGGTAVVRYAGETAKLSNGLAGVKLDIDGMDGPGTYSGEIDLIDDAEEKAGAVTLSVVTKDFILWPVLAIMFGLWVALWLRRWRGVGRSIVQWRQRLKGAESDYAAKRRAMKGKPWHGYDAEESFKEKVDAARDEVDQASQRSYDELDDDTEKAITESLDELQEYVDDLDTLHKRAAALQAALEQVNDLPDIDYSGTFPPNKKPLPPLAEEPAFVTHGRDRLLKGVEVDVDELKEILGEMETTLAVAEDFLEWHTTAQSQVEWLTQLPPEDRDDAGMERARGLLIAALVSIYTAPSGQDLQDGKAEEQFRAAAQAIRRQQGEHGGGTIPGRRRGVATERADVSAEAEPPAPARRRAVLSAKGRDRSWFSAARSRLTALRRRVIGQLPLLIRDPLKRNDGWMVAIAWIVAIATGLTALYFGKTFGSLTDYLLAGLWGLTTGTAVDALAEVARTRRQVAPGGQS